MSSSFVGIGHMGYIVFVYILSIFNKGYRKYLKMCDNFSEKEHLRQNPPSR